MSESQAVNNLSVIDRPEIIKQYRINDKDTGSPEVQIALITKRLEVLSKHFQSAPKDKHSQMGMFNLISKRKRLLTYLKNEDVQRYRKTIASLGIRK
jgi:small subunit ribosomal protein S15